MSIAINTEQKEIKTGFIFCYGRRYKIGTPTDYYSNGIRLNTGDEIKLPDGRVGVIVSYVTDFVIFTNKEIARFQENNKSYNSSSFINPNNVNILRHFNELNDGDTVAVGKITGIGFKVQIINSNIK